MEYWNFFVANLGGRSHGQSLAGQMVQARAVGRVTRITRVAADRNGCVNDSTGLGNSRDNHHKRSSRHVVDQPVRRLSARFQATCPAICSTALESPASCSCRTSPRIGQLQIMPVRAYGMQVGAVECRPVADNPGLRVPSVAVNAGRKSCRLQVCPVWIAGRYTYPTKQEHPL